ncbi:cell division protein ZapE [Salmonella enterica subsp. enterica]|nr:cell division protein ZapE [Salmonella enterica subsp. enterica]
MRRSPRKISATPPGGLIARLGKLLGKTNRTRKYWFARAVYWGAWGAASTAHGSLLPQPPGERKLIIFKIGLCCACAGTFTRLQGQIDPLNVLPDRFKTETDVLCSMSFVTDITDAMLLGGLMKALFARRT